MSVKFIFSRGFLKDVRRLRKRYRLVEDDIDVLLAEMEHENFRGDFMPGIGADVYKVRLANRSARRGKRGGFRVLYRLEADNSFMFLRIYSKTDDNDPGASEIVKLLSNLD